MRKFLQEFKQFISRGNVLDLAVGVIIAAAFNAIVNSLVNDIIMPLITYATGAQSLADLSIPLRWDATGAVTLAWAYGAFIQAIINFLIIALSIFVAVKIVVSSQKKFKEIGQFITAKSAKERRAEYKMLKARAKEEGKSLRAVWKEYGKEKKAEELERIRVEAEEKAQKDAEDKRLHPTQEQLLLDIRNLLKEQKSQSVNFDDDKDDD